MNHVWHLIDLPFTASVLPSEARYGSVAVYPNKPIRLIVPAAAGGPTEMIARLIGQKLTESWRQPVLIDLVQGKNGAVGTQVAATAAPDGYTLLLAVSTHYINPSIFRTLPFDSVKDFEAVSLLISGPNILVVHPSVSAQSVSELIAFAKSKSGDLKYASGGHGSPSHVAAELFKIMTGVDIVHVPYKGHAAAEAALFAGREVHLMFDALLTCMPEVKTGKLRALAMTTAARTPTLPDIPTMAECGLSGYEVSPAMGVLAPAGTPHEVVSQLSKELAKIMQMSDVKERLQSAGAVAIGSTPDEFAAYIKSEMLKWRRTIKDAGIQAVDLPS